MKCANTAPMASAVKVSGLRKSFGAVNAVNGIDLEVPAGARFGLIGQNGAGKTSFIKLLLGIVHPDEGTISLLGGDPHDPAIRRRVGYLPERLTIPPSFSALAFLDSVARLKGVPSSSRAAECKDLLHLVGLEEGAWSRKSGGYSKGMRQRTGLAAALIGAPDLLVLDEPTDGIDPIGRRHIRDIILDVAKRGATIFLNSHLLAETERVCDHVAVMHKGNVVVSGALDVLQRKDSFRVAFVAEPAHAQAVAAAVAAHGFVVDEQAQVVDRVVARFSGHDAAALSQALGKAIGDGIAVVEVAPELVELEAVLERSMNAANATTTNTTTNTNTTVQA